MMLIIQEQYRKDFVLEPCELGAQVILDDVRRGEGCTAGHLLVDDLTCRFKNLFGRCRQVVARSSRIRREDSGREMNPDMVACSGCSGGISPTRYGAAQLSQGHRRPAAANALAREALDCEHAVTR